MRAFFAGLLALVGVVLAQSALAPHARAQCAPGVTPHDVPYACTAAAPYLDFVGVCVPENTGYYCGTSCTVCFCGSSLALRTPCPPSDAGVADAGGASPPACQGSCGPCAEAEREALVVPWAPLLALVGAWRRRSRRPRAR